MDFALTPPLASIKNLLQDARYETARRVCHSELERTTDAETRTELWLLLHSANRFLGDYEAAREALAHVEPANDVQTAELLLRRAEDACSLAANKFYRTSPEARAGLTYEQYEEKWNKEAALWLEKAVLYPLSDSRARISALYKRLGIPEPAAADDARGQQPVTATSTVSAAKSSAVQGVLRFPDGTPVAGAKVTLGLAMQVEISDAGTYAGPAMHAPQKVGPQEALYTLSDENGAFSWTSVPCGHHEFVAVTLDETRWEIPTRFLVHGVEVRENEITSFDLTVDEWQSAPPREVENPFPETLERAEGNYRLLHTETHKNPFQFEFPRQLIHFPVPAGSTDNLLLLNSASEAPQTYQLSGDELYFFADLPPLSDRVWALYEGVHGAGETAPTDSQLTLSVEGGTAIIDTGRAQFCLPWGEGFQEPPLLKVRGEDGAWRGAARWTLPGGVEITAAHARQLEWGPVFGKVRLDYQLSGDRSYSIEFTFHAGEAYLSAHEISTELAGGAWEFSLREWSGEGRGFLHWTPEHGNAHWSTLSAEDRELARLQESVPWWIYPAGFGYAMTAGGLESRDYLGLFTLRRGDWVDREFEKLTWGPKDENGQENRELDWPFPEMVGSTISMLTAHTDASGDAFFRWNLFEGERHWGFLVSTLERNDGTWKEISAVQHKNSSPTLQEFKGWHLDEQDVEPRPYVVARREDLIHLREKRSSPAFAPVWKKLSEPTTRGAKQGVVFAVEGDPLVAWRKKRQIMGDAPVRSKMTLLGRDFADMYSPVGGRSITPMAEEYDLIAASGVFTPAEEREVRACLMLMGHLYMSPDLMNWKNGSRNANFEADRVDVVSAIGLCFPDNPDSSGFIEHTIEGMERALEVYCTPGSGKWYENPACYYLQASKCRANLAFHLWRDGHYDVSRLARFKEFLNWGITLLTPPCPHEESVMIGGCPDEEYRAKDKVRRLPPIGDHARLGPWVPEHYALMSRVYRESDPEFAARLMWAYRSGGSDGAYFGNMPLYFAALEETDLSFETGTVPESELQSRVLEGFGAVFRGHVGQADEFYLLLKQGPGGYRYHRTEGSFLLFADGKPLVYDGGEAGETWRHSTLSFYESQMPLAPGHVERFHSDADVDWVSGVHPTVIRPEDPVFLSDSCHHELVPESWRRFREPNPAAVRSVVWVKDEYVVIHDELHLPEEIPSHWHLQVVAEGETGNASDGLVFEGRFGTDVQVLLPDQEFAEVHLETVANLEYKRAPEECFAQRHLRVASRLRDGNGSYLAVIRPLSDGKAPLRAEALRRDGVIVGAHIWGEGIDDHLFFHRDGMEWHEGADFVGAYGAILKRGDEVKRIDAINRVDGASGNS